MAEFIETTLMDGFADGPHVTEVQIGLANQAVIGPDDYVLEGGRESEAQILTITASGYLMECIAYKDAVM